LVHPLRRVQAAEQDEQISQSKDEQKKKEQTAADDDAGVELGGIDTHEKLGV